MNSEDPFIIIKDHRTKQANQRMCFRVLDANTLEHRPPSMIRKPYSYEDKENCHLFEDEDPR